MTLEQACQWLLDCVVSLEAEGFRLDFRSDYDGALESVDVCKPGEPRWASVDLLGTKDWTIREPVIRPRLSSIDRYASWNEHKRCENEVDPADPAYAAIIAEPGSQL